MAVKKRKKKKSAAPIVLVAFAAAAVFALVYLFTHYYIVMGSLCLKDEPIDLREKTVSVRKFKSVSERFPDSVVLWNVPIGEYSYDCLSEEIRVGNFSMKEIENFSYFPKLRSVDARGADCSDEIRALIRRFPSLDVHWLVPIGEGRFDNRSEELAVGDFSMDEVKNFSYFKSLKRVDATAASCYAEIMAMRELLGEDVDIRWNVVIGGESFPHTTKELALPGFRTYGMITFEKE